MRHSAIQLMVDANNKTAINVTLLLEITQDKRPYIKYCDECLLKLSS